MLFKEIEYKKLKWYVIETNEKETRLLLKDILDEERIRKYSTNDWYVNKCFVAHSYYIRAPFNWDNSYIKNTILSNFEKDIECKATLLTKDEAKSLPCEVRKCNDWYWTKSNASNKNDRCAYAWDVDRDGNLDYSDVDRVSIRGVRPVIKISTSKLLEESDK